MHEKQILGSKEAVRAVNKLLKGGGLVGTRVTKNTPLERIDSLLKKIGKTFVIGIVSKDF